MLVSSWARSKVFLWAVGAPIVALLIVRWISFLIYGIQLDGGPLFRVVREIVVHGLAGVMPGIWFKYHVISPDALMLPDHAGLNVPVLISQSWASLASAEAWIGVAAGVAMLYAAVRIRRWRDEG
jgi:ABC-2 type transport system permease protein